MKFYKKNQIYWEISTKTLFICLFDSNKIRCFCTGAQVFPSSGKIEVY